MSDQPGSSVIVEQMDIQRIMTRIPHRYPLLMIDRILELEPHERCVGLKCVSIGEPCFQGHFPGHPIMPGILIVESMAQTAAVMVVTSLGSDAQDKLVYFMSVENAKFRRPVTPGDVMRVEVVTRQRRGPVWKFGGVALVDGKRAAEAEFTAMMRDR